MNPSKQAGPLRAALLVLTLVPALFAPTAQAGLIQNGGCVDDVTASFFANRVPTNCTANDVTFVLVGLGVQTDGCTADSDSVSIFLRAIIENTTAQTRYDIGMYIATDGDPNGDGAASGVCSRASIDPLGTTGQVACPPLDLDGPLFGVDLNVAGVADGPYLSAETGGNNSAPDSCGDLNARGNGSGAVCDENADGFYDSSVVDFPQAITFPCQDTEGDGFVNVPTCATWGNQANEVHGNAANDSTCDSATELVPGTKAKCRCENINSTIPMPRMSCSTTCTPTRIQPGETTTCTVTVTNNAACTPDPGTSERFRCGTAGFIRFKTELTDEILDGIDYGDFGGEGGMGTAPTSQCNGGTCVNVAAPTLSDTDAANGADRITWNAESSASNLASIMGPNGDSASLAFEYTLDPSFDTSTGPASLTFSTTGYWANVATFTSEVEQTALSCGATISTPVTLAAFTAHRDGETITAEWSTATEIGAAGFNLYEELEDGWRRVNAALIPARGGDSTVPHHYRVELKSLDGGRLYLENVDADGGKRLFGPFGIGEHRGVRPEQRAIDWQAIRAENEPRPELAERRAGFDPGVGTRLLVNTTGLYRVSYEELAAAGFDFAGVQASHLALARGDQAVPIRVEAGGAQKGQRFGPGGFIEFYGEALDTLYSRTNVYLLRVDPALARRVAVDRQTPRGTAATCYRETVRVERDRAYSFGTVTDDPWYDTRLLAFTRPVSETFSFDVDDHVEGAAPARLTVELWGSSVWSADPDHHLVVSLNGVPLADELFNGRVAHTVTATLPPGLLREGGNTLTLTLPADLGVDFDLIHLEGFTVTYPRAFTARGGGLAFRAAAERFEVDGLPTADAVAWRLVEGGAPVLLTGLTVVPSGGGYRATFPGSRQEADYAVVTTGSLLVPTLAAARPLTDITHGTAEYLIVSHPHFLGALDPLVRARQAGGLTVRTVDVRDVYAQFSHGLFDPRAIRDYIAHAATHMGTRFVLLVGGDTFDYRNDLGIGSVSYIPSLYAATGGPITFAPVDALYADVDRDGVPDLAIGRLPVRTVAELDSLIARTLEYEGKNYPRTSVFAADELDRPSHFSFARHSDEILGGLSGGWSAERLYLDQLEVATARAHLIAKVNAGVALTCFIGHSGPTAWTFDGLFTSADAAALDNPGRPTVVMQWGCWNTYHVEPRINTLGHSLLLSGDRGAAAVMGSSTLFETSSAEPFSRLLVPRLSTPGLSIGEAVTAAKQELARSHPERVDALLGWTILGDPALVVEP